MRRLRCRLSIRMASLLAVHERVLPGWPTRKTLRRDGDRRRPHELDVLREGGDDRRVELRAGAAAELSETGLRGPPRAIDPVGGDRVVRVGDEDDPRPERDLLAAQAVRIARAVP